MRILSLKPVQENCKICKRPFSNNVGEFFNPLGYVPSLCQLCNHDMLINLLHKGHCIFKNDFVNEINRKYFSNN